MSDIIQQWVSRVVTFSSQYNNRGWSANSVIGEPKVYPRYGDIPGAWASREIDAYQFLHVGFEKKVIPIAVNIYQTYHAGAVKSILAGQEDDDWVLLWENPHLAVIKESRILSVNVNIDEGVIQPVDELIINIDCSVSGTWVEIDAVQLIGRRDVLNSNVVLPTCPPMPFDNLPSYEEAIADPPPAYFQLNNQACSLTPAAGQEFQLSEGTRETFEQKRDYTVRQWISKVNRYSSQYDSENQPAKCMIGGPRVYPAYGDMPGAWAIKAIDDRQFVEVEYERKIYIKEINIYETFHAGAVTTIKVKNPQSEWETVWQNSQIKDLEESRIFSPKIKKIHFPANKLRIEINALKSRSSVQLDAVETVGSEFHPDLPVTDDLSYHFGRLMSTGLFSDVTFLVQGKQVKAHKAILCARCPYFRAMFSDMPKSTSGTAIRFNDINSSSFELMLYFIYTNCIPDINNCVFMVDVCRVADLFTVDGLKILALHNISKYLQKENVIDIYVEACTKPPVIDVKKMCMEIISTTFSNTEIARHPKLKLLPKQTLEEIIKMLASNKSCDRKSKACRVS